MKAFIILMPVILLFSIFTIFQQDSNIHQYYLYKLKYVAEEMTVAGAQYISEEEYVKGRVVFNKDEGNLASKKILIDSLGLDENFIPNGKSYFDQKVEYKLMFFDDGNTVFPINYKDNENKVEVTLSQPTVIGTINVGYPKYRVKFIKNTKELIRTAIFEWQGY